jgi:hypothetical protein
MKVRRRMMKSRVNLFCVLTVACFLLVLSLAGPLKAQTIATFQDPSVKDPAPAQFFIIDLANHIISGGWPDSQSGLSLNILGTAHDDVFFTMTDVAYSGDVYGGSTGRGIIKFFEDGHNPGDTPLLQIVFASASVSQQGFGSMDPYLNNGVTITGSAISQPLTNEIFSFSFANNEPINGDWAQYGCTATASFTSSATIVPEPVTVMLLGIGGLVAFCRKRK